MLWNKRVDKTLTLAAKFTMHYRRLWVFLGIIYIAVILAVSLLRVPEINIEFSHTDKIIHFLMYFILVGWFIQLYHKPESRLAILLAAILFGLLIEYLQGMTSYRSFDYVDEIANSAGAALAFLLAGTSFNTLLGRIDRWIYHKSETHR